MNLVQFRKQAEHEKHLPQIPYMTHLAEVMAIVMQGYGDEDQQIAALFHDALEDVPVAPDGSKPSVLIEERFGQRVLKMVHACTDGDDGTPRTPETWRPRKKAHLEHMQENARELPEFLLVSIADKISNCSAIVYDVRVHGDSVWKRFNASPEDLDWYYGSLREIYREHLGKDHPLVKRYLDHWLDLTRLVERFHRAGSE